MSGINLLKVDDLMRFMKMTNLELSEKTGISPASISKIRNGANCRKISVLRIARALGVDVTEIQKKEEEQK